MLSVDIQYVPSVTYAVFRAPKLIFTVQLLYCHNVSPAVKRNPWFSILIKYKHIVLYHKIVLLLDKIVSLQYKSVLQIRIQIPRIHMFSNLPDPDPLVLGRDPAADPSFTKQKSKKTVITTVL
jgi:hypothetical protein